MVWNAIQVPWNEVTSGAGALALLLSLSSITPGHAPTADMAPNPFQQSEYIQPSVRESASGEFALLENPSNREGLGPARLTLMQNGETVWSAQHSFTLWEYIVTNRGVVFGYCFSSTRPRFYCGEIRVVLISPVGQVLLEEVHRQVEVRCVRGMVPLPLVRAVHLREDLELAILHVDVPAGGIDRKVEWWSYDLNTGGVRNRGGPDLPANHAFVSDGEFVEATAHADSVPRQIAVNWTQPLSPIELDRLPSVKLQNGQSGSGKSAHGQQATEPPSRIDQPAAACIDGSGRVAILDLRTKYVHVFSGAGELVLVCRAGRGQAGVSSGVDDITISGGGRVLVESDTHPSRRIGRIGEVYTLYDERGQFVQRVNLELRSASFVTGTENCWGERQGHVILLDAAVDVLDRLDRRPDGRFWTYPTLVAGRGRELAVVDGGSLIYYDDQNTSGRIVPCPTPPGYRRLAHGGRWITISDLKGKTIVFDKARYKFHMFDPPEDLPQGPGPICGFSPNRKELWMLSRADLTLHRFLLPTD